MQFSKLCRIGRHLRILKLFVKFCQFFLQRLNFCFDFLHTVLNFTLFRLFFFLRLPVCLTFRHFFGTYCHFCLERRQISPLIYLLFLQIIVVISDIIYNCLIGQIQEETHRFAITFHHESHSKSSTRSALDGIPGVGKVRAQALLKTFKSVKAIREADIFALERVLPKDAAASVYLHFHGETGEKEEKM